MIQVFEEEPKWVVLNGKVVFIAGATAGIGAVAACLFAREGAKVAVAGRRAAEAKQW